MAALRNRLTRRKGPQARHGLRWCRRSRTLRSRLTRRRSRTRRSGGLCCRRRRRGRRSGGRDHRGFFRCLRCGSCGLGCRSGTTRRWRNRLEGRNRLGRGFGLWRGLRHRRLARCFGGGLRLRLCRLRLRGRGLEKHAAHQVGDVIGNDAELILRFENAAQTLVEEGDKLFRREPYLFCKFKNPNFSGCQSLPFTLQARCFPVRGRLHVPSPHRRSSPIGLRPPGTPRTF